VAAASQYPSSTATHYHAEHNILRTSTWPLNAARHSALRPVSLRLLGSAPISSKCWITCRWPWQAASERAVCLRPSTDSRWYPAQHRHRSVGYVMVEQHQLYKPQRLQSRWRRCPDPSLPRTYTLVTACEITFVQLIFHFIQITVESRFHELRAISAVFVATVHC
jgi:hypothetical protein